MADDPRASGASLARPDARRLLSRILDQPDLVEAVQRLPAAALGRLVDHVGLEDAGELVALASTAQLGLLLDEDTWKSARPGADERFDAARFSLWLEVLLEAGEQAAARRMAELPEDFVTLALQRQVMVIDLDALVPLMMEGGGHEADQLEKALEGGLQQEFDQYRVIARRHDGWDALLSLLIALDRDHRALFERVMERCAAATSELAEDAGGLTNLLSRAEMLESDAAAEREDRRAREGYIAPSQAAAFLKLARATTPIELHERFVRDPITRAYFREYAPSRTPAPAATGEEPVVRVADARLAELLREADVIESRPERMLGAGDARRPDEALLGPALRRLGDRDPAAHQARVDELGFLANVLLAGGSIAGRRLRPLQAAEAATALCSLALEWELATESAPATAVDLVERAATRLVRTTADMLFRFAWYVMHHSVALPAAHELYLHLTRLTSSAPSHAVDGRVTHALRALKAALRDKNLVAARRSVANLVLPPAMSEAARVAPLVPLLDELPLLPGPPPGRFISSAALLNEATSLIQSLR